MRRKKLNVKCKTLKGYGLLGHGTEKGMEADDLLCSRNARSKTPLVGRAQWKVNQPPSLKRKRARLERREGAARCPSCSQNAHDEGDGRTPMLVLCSRNARPQKGLVRRPHLDQHGCPSRREKQASLEGSLVGRGGCSFDARIPEGAEPLRPAKWVLVPFLSLGGYLL